MSFLRADLQRENMNIRMWYTHQFLCIISLVFRDLNSKLSVTNESLKILVLIAKELSVGRGQTHYMEHVPLFQKSGSESFTRWLAPSPPFVPPRSPSFPLAPVIPPCSPLFPVIPPCSPHPLTPRHSPLLPVVPPCSLSFPLAPRHSPLPPIIPPCSLSFPLSPLTPSHQCTLHQLGGDKERGGGQGGVRGARGARVSYTRL